MNEEYPRELFSCQECDCIKEHSVLLDCFHNICDDCGEENNEITCTNCPDNLQKPREGVIHLLNQLLYQSLNNPGPDDPNAKKCAICGKMENTIYCTVCKTFWCELGIEEYHVNRTIAGADRHALKRDVSNLNLQALVTGEGEGEDETKFNEMLEVLEELDQVGKENQMKLAELHTELDERMREEEQKVGIEFEGIIERMLEQKSMILEELNDKCNIMHERLEENMKRNEINLSTISRALLLITKMKEHKVIAEPMEQFFEQRNIIEKNRTHSFEDINHEINWEHSKHLPLSIFEVDSKVKIIPDGKNCTIEKIISEGDNLYTFIVSLEDKFGNKISDLRYDVNLKIKENNVKGQLGYDKPNYSVTLRIKEDRKYIAELYIYENRHDIIIKSIPITIPPPHPEKFLELITPNISAIPELGLHRAIAATNDSLYCVVKDPPEIRKYVIVKASERDVIPPGIVSLKKDPISFETNFGEGLLGSPCGICYLDAEVYVVDAGFNCVHVITNNGVYNERFGNTGRRLGQFQRPMGIDYDYLSKEMLIADTFNNRIQACALDTKRFSEFGTTQTFKLKDPVDVKCCKNGNTVVTTLGGQIVLYQFRTVTALVMNGVLTPRHCCVDSVNNIYVTSHLGHCVYKITQTEGSESNFERTKLQNASRFQVSYWCCYKQ